jgi:hypothetical protein
MAIRTPLKIDSANLKEMSSTDTTNIISRMVYLYMTDPSVTLGYVASGGSLAAMNDTRTQASAATSHASSFQTSGAVSTITVSNDKIHETVTSNAAPADTNNIRFPVYNDSGNVKAMSLTDMYDSFVSLATNGTSTLIPAAQPYKIDTSATAPGGYTQVSPTPIFVDTIANLSAYTAGGIPEAQDQPTTATNYYLHKNNGTAVTAPTPLYIDSNQNLKEYTAAELDVVLKEVVRYAAQSLTSNKLRFYIDGAGTSCGTGMINKKYNSSAQQQVQVGDDYRTQRFPAGSAVAVNTYYLKARKE